MKASFKTATDFRKSLEACLKKVAHKTNQDLQRIRRKMAFERFLARVFCEEASDFVLKGGYAMELRFGGARATKDVDLTCLYREEAHDFSIEEMITRELRRLAKLDLQDFFMFEVGDSRLDLDNAPYGGARYTVSSFIDHRLFVRFQIDIGADVIVDQVDEVEGVNWLEYCGIVAPKVKMISVEQQIAEKLHAYSLPRSERVNSRTKDLIDLLLLIKMKKIDVGRLCEVVSKVFKTRSTHELPTNLSRPPLEWESVYKALAGECGIELTIDQAFEQINQFFVASLFTRV